MSSFFDDLLTQGKVELKNARSTGRGWWRWLKIHWQTALLWAVGAGLFFGGLLLIWAATLQLPDLASLQSRKQEQSLKLYDRTGTVLLYDLNNETQRTAVPLDQISPNLQDAIIAIEDPEFYTHIGIKPRAIVRAIITDLIPGGLTQGGSTITQQVIKNSVLTKDKTLTRKFKEWVLALKLERVLSKQQILTLYLNQVPFGGRLYGAEEASQTFFGKHASDLSLVEAVYLAAVMPAPTYYSPYGLHRDALERRKNLVLSKMFEHGYITKEQQDEAAATTIEFKKPSGSSIQAPHFVFYVEQYLQDKYGDSVLEEGGWKVTTTLDADLQAKAEEVVQGRAQSQEDNFNASNTAMVGLDPKTGHILVMVGSRNYFDEDIGGNFNAATTKPGRQPGSAFKPFAYAQAFTDGYTPETVLFDVQTQFSTACQPTDTTNSESPCYSPGNYDNKFRGPMTLREAIAQSINVPSVKVLYLAGIADTLRLAKSLGITTLGNPNQYGLTLVLGGGEVTLLEMTSAYGAFAQNGVHYNTVPVIKVEDGSGNVIEDNTAPQGQQVLSPLVAQQINDVLSDPVARAPLGENTLFTFPGRDVAVKTGTTNDTRDAWTIGYTPNFVLGIWAGNNDNSPMVKKVSGFIVGPMWNEVMSYALDKLPGESFARTDTDTSGLKPQLRGVWQVPGSDGAIHEILYWVERTNPQGPAPLNPSADSQFEYWDYPVRSWVARNGYTAPAPAPVQQTPVYTPQQQTPGGPAIPGGVQLPWAQ